MSSPFLVRNASFGLIGTACLLFLMAACTSEQANRHAFIERLGVDTLSIEVYSRTVDGFAGDVVVRNPVTRMAHFEAHLSSGGFINHMATTWHTPDTNPEGPPDQGYTVTVEGDSATIARWRGEESDTLHVAVPDGVLPVVAKLPIPFAFLDQAIRQARARQKDDYPVPFLYGNGRIRNRTLERVSADTVSLDFFGAPMIAGLDATGRILWRSGSQTTLKTEGVPIVPVNLGAIAAGFAARDATGKGLGVASPTDSVEARIGRAHLKIIYSRPAMRGRKIWGELVPYGRWWRTGANAATTFTTDRDLAIGDVRVPAGSYTLFSIITPDSARLIINKQTGQWGTVYDESRDLARVDMIRDVMTEPMERFTITIEPADGMLRLGWNTTRFSVPIRAH